MISKYNYLISSNIVFGLKKNDIATLTCPYHFYPNSQNNNRINSLFCII